MFDFTQARKNMVDGQIHTNGVVNPKLLHAFETVPKELFVPKEKQPIAYYDEEVGMAPGRTILEPIAHSKMLEALSPGESDIILDVGCGTGYSCAILCDLVTTVIAVEEDKTLVEKARGNFQSLDISNIVLEEAALLGGCPEHAPYDLIVLNGAVASVPKTLVSQLAPGGKMACIVQKPGEVMGEAMIVQRHTEDSKDPNSFSQYSLFNAAASYLPGFEPLKEFAF